MPLLDLRRELEEAEERAVDTDYAPSSQEAGGYSRIQFLARFCTFLARSLLVLGAGLAAGVVFVSRSDALTPRLGLAALGAAVMLGLVYLALAVLSEIVRILIDIEVSTSRSVHFLETRHRREHEPHLRADAR